MGKILEQIHLENDFDEINFLSDYVTAADPVPTGIESLDKLLGGGLCPGGYTIIGGTPGCGKSALAVCMAYHMAAAGMEPLYISLEMPAQQIRMRIASLHSITAGGLEPFAWSSARDNFKANFTPAQLEELNGAGKAGRKRMGTKYIHAFEKTDPVIRAWRDLQARDIAQRTIITDRVDTLEDIAAVIRERADEDVAGAVFIDYAQLIQVPGVDNECERMTMVSREIQRVSMGTRFPVVLLSSLRKINGDKEPSLEWLRGSAYLGYDSVTAWIIKRVKGLPLDTVETSVYTIKNRNGRNMEETPATIYYEPRFNRFT